MVVTGKRPERHLEKGLTKTGTSFWQKSVKREQEEINQNWARNEEKLVPVSLVD